MVTVPLYVVDAFASQPFTGNPAAVCLLDEPADEGWMQSVAAEMQHSETAFVRALEDGFELRWFTPTTEVELCGHATLASAHVLWEASRLDSAEPARFHTRFRGLLTAQRTRDGIEMDFPADPPDPATLPDGLADAMGAAPKETMQARAGYLIEVADEREVRGVQPDFALLTQFESVILTSTASGNGYDFVSRYFAPGYGIDEDPVTGSAHCALGPYWTT
ncbi:MAG TPA: PhzF family phenazine biosynthesis protein, partial [Acidimicrobiia bacterium]|nr:PhzF family phenazine biosynthesis protein [Acidimicrobiia bacterium]